MANDTHSKAIGYIMWIFGFMGMHRSYYGRQITGTIWLFTLGLFFIGWIIWLLTMGLFGFGWLYDLWTLNGQVDEVNSLYG
jgi:TM2 domain-containing membrane protein YozV